MISRREALRNIVAGAGALAGSAVLPAPAARRPNVVFIFLDDLGYGDLGVTGNRDVATPHMDSLARDGVQFTQFYVASPICSPSRVGVTTGQYPARHLIHSYLNTRESNRALGMCDYLNPSAPCLARAFQRAGYATGHFGKWHMGGGRDVNDAPLPRAYGFDEALSSFEGLGDRVLEKDHRLSEQSARLGRGRIQRAPKHQLTEIWVDHAIQFIRRHASRPFYLQLWPSDVHDVHRPRPDLMEKYARFSSNPFVQSFYAVLDELDRQIGRLLGAIDETGLAENTLVVFTGDNGPTAWPRYYEQGFQAPGSTAGLRGRKWSLYEGGIRQPFFARWKGSLPAGLVDKQTVVGAVDLFPTLCTLAGISPPRVTFDGHDMSTAFGGKPRQRARPLLWEYGRDERLLRPGLKDDQSPNLAIRDDRWKLLVNGDGSRLELYDFDVSDKERENVAKQHPAVVDRLSKAVLAWRRSWPVLTEAKGSPAVHFFRG